MKRIFIFLFFLTAKAHADEIPVLLFLNTYDQVDSLGINIVESLPAFVYDRIMDKTVTLWDSPKKEDQIEPRTLMQIEKDAQSSFSITNQLFIYENWMRERKSLTIRIAGFYFSSKKPNGEEVAYGFVDYVQLDSLFQITEIPANADGGCGLSFDQALKQKRYTYNIVQYGARRIESVDEALKLKEEIRPLLPRPAHEEETDCKTITYAIEDSVTSLNPAFTEARKMLAATGKFLTEAPEFFLNIGGDRLTLDPSAYKISVDRIDVEEHWMRHEERIEYSIDSMKIYVNGQPMNSISWNEIQHLDYLVGFKPVGDLLKEKEFYFRILKINSQEIPAEKAEAYLEGLNELRWNHLIEWAGSR